MTLGVGAMVHWYELVAGLQPVCCSKHAAWLTDDEADHRIALLRLPGTEVPVDKLHTDFEHTGFDQGLDDYVRLREAGIAPALNLHHGMTMSMYYADPDGNGVEIQVDFWGDWPVSKDWRGRRRSSPITSWERTSIPSGSCPRAPRAHPGRDPEEGLR